MLVCVKLLVLAQGLADHPDQCLHKCNPNPCGNTLVPQLKYSLCLTQIGTNKLLLQPYQ